MQMYDFRKVDDEVEVIEREDIKSDDPHVTNLSPDFIKNIQDGMKIKLPTYKYFMITDHRAFKQWMMKIHLNKDPSICITPLLDIASMYHETDSPHHKRTILGMVQEIFNTVKG